MNNSNIAPFHLAIPVTDLVLARKFYGELLGCTQGRCDSQWIDWNFFGHQLVTHLVANMPTPIKPNEVDSKHVPVPHFGIVFPMQVWRALTESLQQSQVDFVIAPYIRFEGQAGEQATCFLHDPFGNALEFKAFKNMDNLFKA
ncbi:glyoxalase [Alteromonas sediminis]|uniref:Glyoxalase n=1 Tax=Alteromonas sediminis TaxID=2259342 RepID=A0A3N5XZX6_9ALTE|nr:VOC family protein [Alteromonas sediminis]RPJ66310.1 glyoxalase [Alteromonas sediminis]